MPQHALYRLGCTAAVWAVLSLPAAATPPAANTPPSESVVQWLCDAVYLPARSSWVRSVRIRYDAQRVRSVHIDDQPVYSFNVLGTTLITALDNERIRIDTATMTWSSDFRGLATSEGRCEP